MNTKIESNMQLLSVKQIATLLNRSTSYVYLMKKAGFKMIHNRASLNDALLWLDNNPAFKTTSKKNK